MQHTRCCPLHRHLGLGPWVRLGLGLSSAVPQTCPTGSVTSAPFAAFDANPDQKAADRVKFGEKKFQEIQEPDLRKKPPEPVLHFDDNGNLKSLTGSIALHEGLGLAELDVAVAVQGVAGALQDGGPCSPLAFAATVRHDGSPLLCWSRLPLFRTQRRSWRF